MVLILERIAAEIGLIWYRKVARNSSNKAFTIDNKTRIKSSMISTGESITLRKSLLDHVNFGPETF
ncbi:hypothetical protein Scep_010704 [Stephania cephalantha]|uniref:Uncharacterized protein n=1 Tax=Stephania cephalantha TaxID=152367 RepID=A0AAP0PDJ6_9MAGN